MRRQAGREGGRGAAGARFPARKRGAADGVWPGEASVTGGLGN